MLECCWVLLLVVVVVVVRACVRACVFRGTVFRGTVFIAASTKTDKFPTISTGLDFVKKKNALCKAG